MEPDNKILVALTRIAESLERIEGHLVPQQTISAEPPTTTAEQLDALLRQHDQGVKCTIPNWLKLTKPMGDYVRLKWFAAKLGTPSEAEIADMFEAFTLHHRKAGTKFKNWFAAWQTWVRNEVKFRKEKAVITNDAGPRGTLL